MEEIFKLDYDVDQWLDELPTGSMSRAINNSLYGINARHKNAPLPMSKDNQGYTFFTRPQLRLVDENVSNSTQFHSMLTASDYSYQRYVRMMLDPRLGTDGFKSPLVDNTNAFIPILSNSIVSMSGMPNMRAPQYTSDSGNYGQQQTFTDGVPNFYEVFDMTVNFKNFKGNFLIYLFTMWILYQSNVFEGKFNPYMDFILNREIDYQTRIYRIITDETNRYVTNIMCTGAAFPVSVPVGDLFDFNSESPLNTNMKDIPITFRCIGFLFNEDIIKLEFNQVQAIFNPDIAAILKHDFTSDDDDLIYRRNPLKSYQIKGSNLIKIPQGIILSGETADTGSNSYFRLNHKMYPYINLATNELEWWADRKYFKL